MKYLNKMSVYIANSFYLKLLYLHSQFVTTAIVLAEWCTSNPTRSRLKRLKKFLTESSLCIRTLKLGSWEVAVKGVKGGSVKERQVEQPFFSISLVTNAVRKDLATKSLRTSVSVSVIPIVRCSSPSVSLPILLGSKEAAHKSKEASVSDWVDTMGPEKRGCTGCPESQQLLPGWKEICAKTEEITPGFKSYYGGQRQRKEEQMMKRCTSCRNWSEENAEKDRKPR